MQTEDDRDDRRSLWASVYHWSQQNFGSWETGGHEANRLSRPKKGDTYAHSDGSMTVHAAEFPRSLGLQDQVPQKAGSWELLVESMCKVQGQP